MISHCGCGVVLMTGLFDVIRTALITVVTCYYKVSPHISKWRFLGFDLFTPVGEGLSERHAGERGRNGRFVVFFSATQQLSRFFAPSYKFTSGLFPTQQH